jgi:hypothetical protein
MWQLCIECWKFKLGCELMDWVGELEGGTQEQQSIHASNYLVFRNH